MHMPRLKRGLNFSWSRAALVLLWMGLLTACAATSIEAVPAAPAPTRRPRPKRGPLPARLRPSKADATAPFAVLGVVAAILFALTALASIAARLGF